MFWQWLFRLLKSLLPAALQSWWAERQRLGEIADKGAKDQRDADDKADAELAEEARKRREELSRLSDDELAHRSSRWMRD